MLFKFQKFINLMELSENGIIWMIYNNGVGVMATISVTQEDCNRFSKNYLKKIIFTISLKEFSIFCRI